MKISDQNLLQGTIPAFSWRDKEIHKITSARTTSLWAEIQTQVLCVANQYIVMSDEN
jgi:hypothetical protein